MCRAFWIIKNFPASRVLPVLLGALVLLGLGPEGAFAAEESLIDFATIVTDIKPLMKTAVAAAAGFGAIVLAAVLCWKFFKRFLQG